MSGSSGDTEKSPDAELLVANLSPRLVDVAITEAPGTTAPDGSVTVPLISPLPASWALARELQSRIPARRTRKPGSNWRSKFLLFLLAEWDIVDRSLLSIICNLSKVLRVKHCHQG